MAKLSDDAPTALSTLDRRSFLAPVQVMTINEAAAVLHCSGRSVQRLLASGALRGFRIGTRGWRITSDALREFAGGE